MLRSLSLAAFAAVLAYAPATAAPRVAKNVIVFIGDGMGISTVTAARIYASQQRGGGQALSPLSFERLPQSAFSRTAAADNLVTDSAAGATAILAGRKVNNETLGVSASVRLGACPGKSEHLVGIAQDAARAGLKIGVVTDARITDATPAALYAHSPSRHWETDADLPAEAGAAGCTPISQQLGEALRSGALHLAFAGGSKAVSTPIDAKTATELQAMKAGADWPRIGLFAPGNFPYVLDRKDAGLPSLQAMAGKAVELLSPEAGGYLLLIEGGLIDKAHHLNDARRALAETLAFADAVESVLSKVDLSETLVIVTADHSHGLTLSAPADRSATILGPAQLQGRAARSADGKPYPVLSYATGPGSPQPALVRLAEAEHSGEDVPVYAAGPGSERVRGVLENTDIHGVIASALGLSN